jgi:hypothetical protein
MTHSNELNPGQPCPVDGCDEEIVTVSHQQVKAPDENIEADMCWLYNENIETEGIVTLSGNVTLIFHEGPSME